MWRATALTIFPEMFPGPLGESLAGKALKEGVWQLEAIDIRRFAKDRHGTVDDAPFGGGAGMVMKPDILSDAIASVSVDVPRLLMSPRGTPYSEPPASPSVTMQYATSMPAPVITATEPAQPKSMSSGCAVIASTRSWSGLVAQPQRYIIHRNDGLTHVIRSRLNGATNVPAPAAARAIDGL